MLFQIKVVCGLSLQKLISNGSLQQGAVLKVRFASQFVCCRPLTFDLAQVTESRPRRLESLLEVTLSQSSPVLALEPASQSPTNPPDVSTFVLLSDVDILNPPEGSVPGIDPSSVDWLSPSNHRERRFLPLTADRGCVPLPLDTLLHHTDSTYSIFAAGIIFTLLWTTQSGFKRHRRYPLGCVIFP